MPFLRNLVPRSLTFLLFQNCRVRSGYEVNSSATHGLMILSLSFFLSFFFFFFVCVFTFTFSSPFSSPQSWFKNRRFKWRKEVRQGSNCPSQGLSLEIPTPNAYLPVMYQAPCVFNSGGIPLTRCQGCHEEKPTNKHFERVFYRYTSY